VIPLEVITKEIKHSRPDVFYIYPIGDIHAGSVNCDEDKFQSEIQKISKIPNAYIVGMGDYCDAILKDDKRFDIGGLAGWLKQDNILESQRNFIVDNLKPVKDKILCMLTGNHEETVHALYQTDQTGNICKDLGVPYAGYSCFLNLHFERDNTNSRRMIQIHAWHGAGAAQTEGARIMRLMRLVNDVQADIYLMGHLHAVTSHSPERLTCSNGSIKSKRLIATLTGSWLKAYMQKSSPSYSEKAGYKPSYIGCPVISIKPDTGEFGINL